ncbi:MAG: hypothetical protein J6T10_19295 [Methanobrevibacter sp.]|nr:hypothetical protein [Methanobrevibacter sp.]
MSRNDFLELIKEFGLELLSDNSNTAYYGLYPICGWHSYGSTILDNGYSWEARSITIYNVYQKKINSYIQKYEGRYSGHYAIEIEEGRTLIGDKLQEIKKQLIEEKLECVEKDFA